MRLSFYYEHFTFSFEKYLALVLFFLSFILVFEVLT